MLFKGYRVSVLQNESSENLFPDNVDLLGDTDYWAVPVKIVKRVNFVGFLATV